MYEHKNKRRLIIIFCISRNTIDGNVIIILVVIIIINIINILDV